MDALWISSSLQQPKQLVILSSKMPPGHLFDDKMNTCHGRLPRPNPLLPRSSNKFSINLPTTLSLYIYHVAEIQAAVFCFFLKTKIIAIKNKNTKEKNGTIVLRLHGFVVVSLSFVLLLTQRERERERERSFGY